MKIITKRDLIETVAQRWREEHPVRRHFFKGATHDTEEIACLLEQLDKTTATDEEVATITGQNDWISTPSCGECGAENVPVIQIGEPIDYIDGRTAFICRKCLSEAVKLFDRSG